MVTAKKLLKTAVIAVAAAFASLAAAEEWGAQTAADKSQMLDGDVLMLQVVFTVADDSKVQGMQLPSLADFQILNKSEGTSSQVTFANGRMEQKTQKRITLQLRPNRIGKLTIEPAVLTVKGGRVYRSAPIIVDVMPSGVSGGAADASAGGSKTSLGAALTGVNAPLNAAEKRTPELFVRAVASKKSAYVGEQVIVAYYLFSAVSLNDAGAKKKPVYMDAWVEQIDIGKQAPRFFMSVDGRDYSVFMLEKVALFPKKAGKMEIGSFEVEAVVGGGFFSQGKRYLRVSQPFAIDVKPLPEANQPPGFSASNVGVFDVSLAGAPDKKTVESGEGFTVAVTVSGEGNIKALKLPEPLENKAFKFYPPTVSEQSTFRAEKIAGSKKAEILAVPTSDGAQKLQFAPFVFFDPEKGAYQTKEIPAIELFVAPGKAQSKTKSSAAESDESQLKSGSEKYRPFRFSPSLKRSQPPMVRRPEIKFLLIGPFAAALTVYGLVGSLALVRAARRAKAEKNKNKIRRSLEAASAAIEADDVKTALAEISAALAAAAEIASGKPFAGLKTESVKSCVAAFLKDDGAGEKFAELLSGTETMRFAPLPPSAETAAKMLEEAGALTRRISQ